MDPRTENDTDLEAKDIATQLQLTDRIERISHRDAFITPKDHKDNFLNEPKSRLNNPAKSEVGIISKQRLQNINSKIREHTKLKLKQWRNTSAVLDWFQEIQKQTLTRVPPTGYSRTGLQNGD